jgi:hypothetical protein
MRRPILLTACLATLVLGGRPATGAERVEVETRGGRVLRGVVDARTDDDRLWIRQEEGGAVLVASTAWGDVVQATVDGQPVAAGDLRTRAAETATAGPRWFAEVEVPPRAPGTALGVSPPHSYAPMGRPHVRSVEIVEACLVNLDRDVEPDGIRVSIAAIGDDGIPMAVRGSLTVRLTGERRPASVPTAEFGDLDRWTQPVAAADFVDGLATYELRFRRLAPEWQFDLLPDAVVDVQLGAHGEGNYAASAPVVLRQFNPLRDHRQLAYGTRFAPRELHGRNPVSTPVRRDGRWIHWTW